MIELRHPVSKYIRAGLKKLSNSDLVGADHNINLLKVVLLRIPLTQTKWFT